MRWVLITALGLPVEPEVSRNFAIVSGPTAACARSTAAVAGPASSAVNGVVLRPGTSPRVTTTSVPAGTTASIARPNFPPSAAKTRPGVRSSKT